MNKYRFEAMLALAEFGAKRMEQRRTPEFQIFISYITLIVLGLYVIITNKQDVENLDGRFLCVPLILINFIYIIWQVGLGRAMENDATIRNYYLKKAQKLTGYPLTVKDRRFPGKKCVKNNEKDYKIIVNTNYTHQFCDLLLIWKDWARLLLVGVPTILHLIFLYGICKVTKCSMDIWMLLAILIPSALVILVPFIFLILIPALKKCKVYYRRRLDERS